MNDQAHTLRYIASTASPLKPTDMENTFDFDAKNAAARTRCIAVTGGKGGVGKSNLAVNLALELGALNKKVNLLDADFGLANADLLCGVSPEFHLGHVVSALKQIEEIMIDLSENVRLIPGGSGIEELANVSVNTKAYIFRKLRMMEQHTDFMVIDTAAGVAENVVGVLIVAEEVIVVATPEPTSIVDAYATVKTILKRDPHKKISIVVNNVIGVGDAEQVFQQINQATKRFLNRQIEFLGMVPRDSQLVDAVRRQTPVVHYAPSAPASRAIRLIAKQIDRETMQRQAFPMQATSFWDALSEQFA